jgi:hypothetical protein
MGESPAERQVRRERWFRLGDAAANAAFGFPVDGLVCSLCGWVAPIDAIGSGDLTDEHV